MNEIRRQNGQAAELERLASIVGEIEMPDFVTGVSFEFYEVQDEPSVMVIFELPHDLPADPETAKRWIDEAGSLSFRVRRHIIDSGEPRFPLTRFAVVHAADRPH